MHNIDRLDEINENIETFLTLVVKSRGKKQIREHFINLTMVYSLETDDCEIFLDQVDGRLSSITEVENNDLGARNNVKPRINKRQAKEINEGTKYFMGRIREAQKDWKIEAIILKHNIMKGATHIFFAHIPN
jgi:aspartate-semialdehyde dehydrogenase